MDKKQRFWIGITFIILFFSGYLIGYSENFEDDNPSNEYEVTEMSITRNGIETGIFGYRVSHRINKDITKACYISYIDGEYDSFCEIYNWSDDTVTKIQQNKQRSD